VPAVGYAVPAYPRLQLTVSVPALAS
jgi:hypothetical protein